jgi:hypothetical protein
MGYTVNCVRKNCFQDQPFFFFLYLFYFYLFIYFGEGQLRCSWCCHQVSIMLDRYGPKWNCFDFLQCISQIPNLIEISLVVLKIKHVYGKTGLDFLQCISQIPNLIESSLVVLKIKHVYGKTCLPLCGQIQTVYCGVYNRSTLWTPAMITHVECQSLTAYLSSLQLGMCSWRRHRLPRQRECCFACS